MKNSRFAEEQIVKMLREADRTSVAAVSKSTGVSEKSIYTWRKQYGGLAVDEVRRLRQLEQENARLKEVLAERVRCSMWHAQHCTSAAAWRRRMSPRWSRCGRCLRSSRATAIGEYRFSCDAQARSVVRIALTVCGPRRA
jgi:putative transposase